MTIHQKPFRGMGRVRAETDPNKVLADLQRAFQSFKDENDARLKAKADVVVDEKVARISASITDMQAALDESNARLAALASGAGGPGRTTANPHAAAYRAGFERYFRKGVEADLGDLAVKASLRSNADPEGGYTVPEEMDSAITELLRTTSIVRSLATVITVGSATYKKLVNRQGAGTGWVGETSARPETGTPVLSALEFPTMELYANPAATRALLDDSAIDIAAWLANEVNGEFAEAEGAAFVSGNGVARPRGLLDYPTIANASYAWGSLGFIASGAAATLAASNPADRILDLVYALRAGYRQNATWLMNDLTTATVRKIKDGQGNYLWQPSIQVGQPATLLGYAAQTDDNMPDIGANAFPIAFGDFRRGYLVTDRQGVRVLRDELTNKPYVHFYTTKRVGGGVQNFEAIKLLKIAAS